MPRFEDGFINLQEALRQLAEGVVNEITGAEAEQLCEATGNSRGGYRGRRLVTCVGTLALRTPKLRAGSFFPDDVIERCQRVDRAIVAAVSETCATGASTRKVRKVAAAMGIGRLSKDQAGAICERLDSEVEELVTRPLGELRTPCLRVDATHVKCRRDRRVAPTAVVTAIGRDEDGRRRVLGLGVVDTGSHDSWLAFPRRIRACGVTGVRLAASDAHEGLRRATEEAFQGAAWQRCVVHLMRDCARAASSPRSLRRRVSRIVAPAFRPRDAGAVRAACHIAIGMLESCCKDAARILEEAEPDALAYLDFPSGHWRRLRANNVQERANRETRRRSRVVQVFPSASSLERLAGAVMRDMDEEWQEARCFSKTKTDEPCDESRAARAEEPPTPERADEWRLVAKRAIGASLELADELEAA